MRRFAFIWFIFTCLGTASVTAQSLSEDFESYGPSDQIAVVGAAAGWQTWADDPTVDAVVLDAFSLSGSNSLFVENGQDIVQVWDTINSGIWVIRGWVYVESSQVGEAYWILLNTYSQPTPAVPAPDLNWSVQVRFDASTGLVSDLGGSAGGPGVGGTVALLPDQWVEVRVEIDLDNNLHSIFYDGVPLRECELWSGGATSNIELQALDLYTDNDLSGGVTSTGVYWDDVSLEEVPVVGGCDAPSSLTCTSAGCTPGPGDVELAWVNGSVYDDVQISRDGIVIATIPGSDTSYVDTAVASGCHNYLVRGVCGGVSSCPITCALSHCPIPLADSILMLNWDATTTAYADGVNTWAADNGWTVTEVADGAALAAEMCATDYEIIVYDNPCCNPAGEDEAILDYVAAGGKVLLSYWSLDQDPAMQTVFGIASGTDFFVEESVYSWCDAHPIWNDPMTVTSPLAPSGLSPWLDNGERSEPLPGASAIGGFLADRTMGEAAMIIANENRTIANTFTPDEMSGSVFDLAYNQMNFLAFPSGCNPPINLTCVRADCSTAGLGDVDLTWENGDTYDDVEVFRDGVLIATLSGGDLSYIDELVDDAAHSYEVRGVCGTTPTCGTACDLVAEVTPECTTLLLRGDSNGDGGLDISDAIFSLNALFVAGSDLPPCQDSADANDDGVFDISDAIFTLAFLFITGSDTPPEPFPTCGADSTPDSATVGGDLGCGAYVCP